MEDETLIPPRLLLTIYKELLLLKISGEFTSWMYEQIPLLEKQIDDDNW